MKSLIPALSFFAIICLIMACSPQQEQAAVPLPYYNGPDFTPEWLEAGEQARHRIADFAFINQEGDTVDQDFFKGKIYVADFFFTFCPGICPKLTQNMLTLQETFQQDPGVALVSHTVAPTYDSVAVLKQYADRHGIDASVWQLFTGEKKALYEVARKSYFADEDLGFTKDENDFLHTENFILVDGMGHIRGVYNGTLPLDIRRLIRDIHSLKQEEASWIALR